MIYSYSKQSIQSLIEDYRNLIRMTKESCCENLSDIEILSLLMENGRIKAVNELDFLRDEITSLRDRIMELEDALDRDKIYFPLSH